MSDNSTFNFQESIREVYLSVLPFQTSIYTHCLLPYSEKIGPNRLLLSPLWRDFKLYAFNKTSKKLECSEKLFPYIPEDNGIMSLNAVKLDPEEPEIITGMNCNTTFLKIFTNSSFFLKIYFRNLDFRNNYSHKFTSRI